MSNSGPITTCLIVILIVGIIIWIISRFTHIRIETPEKRAGRLGERFATTIISEVLRDDDILLTNVEITAEGKQTELDNVIINENGIFIIETKNYNGYLTGDEDTYDWIQTKTTYAGNIYQKRVKNPIKQVKRQIYILSRFLKHYGINAWINGYVFLVERNSPVESAYVLNTRRDIDRAIHKAAHRKLAIKDIEKIKELLE